MTQSYGSRQLTLAEDAYSRRDYTSAAEHAFEALGEHYDSHGKRWQFNPDDPFDFVMRSKQILENSLKNHPSVDTDMLKRMKHAVRVVYRRIGMMRHPKLYLAYDGTVIIMFAALMILSILALWELIPYIYESIMSFANGTDIPEPDPFASFGFFAGIILMIYGALTSGGLPSIPSGKGIDDVGMGCMIWIVIMVIVFLIMSVIAPVLMLFVGYTTIQERLGWYR